MFLLWSSDLSPVLTHSPSSRFPICVLPASRYVYENGVNVTLEAVTRCITKSVNEMSSDGIPIHTLPSLGSGEVPCRSTS